MGGPNLEVFKFGLYLFVPIWALLQFGDPEWYNQNVVPVRPLLRGTPSALLMCFCRMQQYKEKLFPPEERTKQVRFSASPAVLTECLECF